MNARITITCDVELAPLEGATHLPDADHPVWSNVLATIGPCVMGDVLDNLEFYDAARGHALAPTTVVMTRRP